jgi:hypothetical protein
MTDAADGRWHPIEEAPTPPVGFDHLCLVAPGRAGRPYDPAKCDGDNWFTADCQELTLNPRWFMLPLIADPPS